MADDEDSSDDDEFMIQCDAPGCGKWYDAIDLNPPLDPITASQYEIWHCDHCTPYHGPSQHRRRRDGLRKRKRINFVKLNDPGVFLENENCTSRIGLAANDVQDVDFGGMIRQRKRIPNGRGGSGSGRSGAYFKRGSCSSSGCLLRLEKGEEFTAAYAAEHGFTRPVLFVNKTSASLGLRVPASRGTDGAPFTYESVAKLVGPFRTIQVIDTATQLTTEYTLREWVDYLETPPKDRTRILNVITLEFSETPLGDLVTEPQFVRDVDFVRLHWPKTYDDIGRLSSKISNNTEEVDEESSSSTDEDELLEELKKERPRVQKYCLMSAAGAYTDFHIDFGGTAVWYHVYFGSKVFYFIEPTPNNIKIYSKWATNGSGSKTKKYEFLPDLIRAAGGGVYEVSLRKGQTLFIPSGWIHAVYTPDDSLVFGGNFVHRHSLEMQLNIYRLEKQMKVGEDFRFPNYQKLMWYTARAFLEECNRMQLRHSKKGSANHHYIANNKKAEKRKIQMICSTHTPRVLRGYNSLAKELERWSISKSKSIIEQFPDDIDVLTLSSHLGQLMKECIAHIDKE